MSQPKTRLPALARLRAARLRWAVLVAVLALTCAAGAGVALAASSGGTSYDAHADAVSRKYSKKTIAKVQRRLGVRPVSGYYGPLTRRAVRRFQRREGLEADGIIGPKTLRALGLRGGKKRRSVRVPAILRRIAECESGGDPSAVSPDGRYRGKYQFSRATWRSLGGEGDPADAPEPVQDRLALKLYRREGTSPWPSCGRAARR